MKALLTAVLAFGSAFTGVGVVRAGSTTCPASFVHLQSYSSAGPFSTAALAYDSTFVDVWTAHVTFDRALGHMSLSALSNGRMTASVRVVEQFDVVGSSPNATVPATMEFRLDGWSEQNCGGSGCGIELQGTLVSGVDSVTADANQIGPGAAHRDLASTLTLPVTFVAGSPINVEFFLEYGTGPGGGGASASANGSYRVSGLPAGVHAFACGGADVTPVQRTSWGMLKQIYR
jgi:hypothetical protein